MREVHRLRRLGEDCARKARLQRLLPGDVEGEDEDAVDLVLPIMARNAGGVGEAMTAPGKRKEPVEGCVVADAGLFERGPHEPEGPATDHLLHGLADLSIGVEPEPALVATADEAYREVQVETRDQPRQGVHHLSEQKMELTGSKAWPMSRLLPCSQQGANLWMQHSKESKACSQPALYDDSEAPVVFVDATHALTLGSSLRCNALGSGTRSGNAWLHAPKWPDRRLPRLVQS